MNAADVILYAGASSPRQIEKVDCPKCLELLMPHLDSYRRAERSSRAVAEVQMSTGVTIQFSSADGNITVTEKVPMIGSSRKLLGLIPLPTRSVDHGMSTDFEIHKLIARAYSGA